MIKRIVLWSVVGETPQDKQAHALRIKQLLESMRGKIPGMLSLEVGVNTGQSADAVDIAFITEFTDAQSLQDYNTHPAHEDIKPEVMSLRDERRVVTYEV